MNRIIRCNVENEFIRGAGVVIGAAGSHDDVELELTFSPVWDGTSKKIVWFDALGEQTVVTVLGVNLLVPGEERRYRVSVPWEAKAVEGDMKLTIRGANVSGNKETRAVVAATACFKVLPALWDPLAVESNEPSADVSDQLQQEIEDIMDDLTLAVAAADAKQAAETSAAAAAGSAAAAAGSASEAQFCANSASIAEDNAKDYMLTCGAYAEEVQTNSAAAAGSATAAAASARSAASSASEAASSASWADRSASRADISATEAAKSAAAAASSASAAASVELNSRKINGKPLSADVILSAGDVGAISGSGAFSSAAIAAPYTLKVESAPGDSWGIGQYWTAHDLPLTLNWTGVAFGFDALTEMSRFVAVAEGSAQAVYSDDGITWNTASLPSSASWQSIAYGGGKFVAVANGSNQAAYSNNGITWNTASLPDASDWQSVAYGGGKFVAVANGSNQAACSEDGVTWTAATLPETDYWKTVTYGACRFVAVADPSNRAAWSADGVHWQLAQLPSLAGWNCLAYGAGKFLAISSTLRAASSPDGENWSYANPPGNSSHMAWMALTYACGVFVAVENGNKAAWSTDGESWRLAGLPSSGEWRALAFGQDTLVTLAHYSNKLARCSDRSLWFNVNGKLTGGGVTRKDIGGVEKSAAAMSETICKSYLSQIPDMGDAVPATRKINGKPLSSDVTLTAEDVGAVPAAGGNVTGTLSLRNSSIALEFPYPGGGQCIKVTGGLICFVTGSDSYPNVILRGINTPSSDTDAANKAYVDNRMPSGVIVLWSGAANAIPTGWALCNGSNGTPDLRDRFVLGAGNKYAVGATGGEETHTLTHSEMPMHSHMYSREPMTFSPDSSYCQYNLSLGNANGEEYGNCNKRFSTDANTSTDGSDSPHNNMPPYYALCYIMKL